MSNNLFIIKRNWPYGNVAALSIGIDDVHPESSLDPEKVDFGGDMDYGNFRYLNELISEMNQIKITLFVTPNWIARPDWPSGKLSFLRLLFRRVHSYPINTFKIDHEKYKSWCTWLANKVLTGKFEVALHGLYHYNPISRFTSQEFSGESLKGCLQKLDEAEKILDNAKIPYVKGLRPPGWGITKELLEALIKKRYLFLAGSSDFKTRISPEAKSNGAGLRGTSLLYPNLYRRSLVLLTANCYANQVQRALQIASAEGLILLHSHIAGKTFGLNYVSLKFVEGVKKIIRAVTSKFGNAIWFASLGEIAKWWLAKEGTTVEVNKIGNSMTIHINNRTEFDALGLTLELKDFNIIGGVSFTMHDNFPRDLHYRIIDAKSFWIDVPARRKITLELRVKE
jgi:peptidoglycan/xylan/chitin deacetylase (PgdA/CDA1 family)